MKTMTLACALLVAFIVGLYVNQGWHDRRQYEVEYRLDVAEGEQR